MPERRPREFWLGLAPDACQATIRRDDGFSITVERATIDEAKEAAFDALARELSVEGRRRAAAR